MFVNERSEILRKTVHTRLICFITLLFISLSANSEKYRHTRLQYMSYVCFFFLLLVLYIQSMKFMYMAGFSQSRASL